MMNGFFRGRKRAWIRMWTGLFCAAFVWMGLLGMTNGLDEQPTLFLTEKDGIWEIHLSVGLLKLTRGEAMALLMEVEIPDGWELEAVEQAEGALGLTLTVGTGEGAVTLLLDGFPKEDGEALVKLRFHEEAEGKPTVRTEGGEVILYCLDEEGNGNVKKIPLLIREVVKDTEEGETTVWETASQEADTEPEQSPPEPSTSEPYTPTETVPYETSVDETPKKPPLFGCQETTVQNGLYAVRFWVFGDDTAVICLEGGGVLLLETAGKGKWNQVTFRGMRGEGRYVFLVYSSRGMVRAVYEDGGFVGFEK